MMQFIHTLQPDVDGALAALGYGAAAPDEKTRQHLQQAATMLEKAAKPRWTYRRFPLENGTALQGTGFSLAGKSIQKHLAGCFACYLLAVTLGDAVERLTRSSQVSDMEQAVLLDTLASTLVEQYADVAQTALEEEAATQQLFVTPRFSPGYGDFPIAAQGDFLRVIDGGRAIGLTVSGSGILLPRKSITAVMGIAKSPVRGHLAGCGECALYPACKGTRACARPPQQQEEP